MTASLLFVDSFDDYSVLTQRWIEFFVGGDFVISSLNPRTGAHNLRATGSNGNAQITQNFVARSTYIFGFAIYQSGVPGGDFAWVKFYDSGSVQTTITLNGSGGIKAWRGNVSNLLGTASTILPFGSYHYVEVKVTFSTTVGVVQIWLDGVQILNLTGVNTSATGSTTAGSVGFQDNGVADYDDLYIMDPTIGAYSTPLGDVKMLLNMPSANGTLNNYTNVFATWPTSTAVKVGQTIQDSNGNAQRVQSISGTGTTGGSHPTWATTGGSTTTDNPGGNQVVWVCLGTGSNPGLANWMAVSEIPPDDDSSYVTDATPGDIERYTYPAIAGSAVKAVVVNIRAEKDDAGTRTIRAACKSGGTSADSGIDLALALNTYADYQGVFETDPNTSVAWTVSGVNAAEFGVKTTA